MPPKDRLILTEWHRRSRSMSTALNAMTFTIQYGQLTDRLGREPSIEEYAEDIGKSRAQGFRRQAAFRVCSPNQDVMSVWAIVKPLLAKSTFKAEGPRAQAIFGLSLKATWETPE